MKALFLVLLCTWTPVFAQTSVLTSSCALPDVIDRAPSILNNKDSNLYEMKMAQNVLTSEGIVPNKMGLQAIEWVKNGSQLGTCLTRHSEKVLRVKSAPQSESRVLWI